MKGSKFTVEDKVRILRERIERKMTIKKLCAKYGISVSTFYVWKQEFEDDLTQLESANFDLPKENLSVENRNLRRLYISLSEHNYELSKLLIK